MDDVITTTLSVVRRAPPSDRPSVAVRGGPLADPARDAGKPARRRAALLAQDPCYTFDVRALSAIPGMPAVYWWDRSFLARYAATPKLIESAPARSGINTGDNVRFSRFWWEVPRRSVAIIRHGEDRTLARERWVPFVAGAKGRAWLEELRQVVQWEHANLELRVFEGISAGCALRSMNFQFCQGVAFAMIGNSFSARAHRYKSVFDSKGASVFPADVATTTCLLNATVARFVLQSLNPSISFQVGDVNRLPTFPVGLADDICSNVDRAFSEHESARESSVEFRRPGSSPWTYALAWAQFAVDRLAEAPLPPYEPAYDPPAPVDFVSFALGVVMGRFGAKGEGILDATPPTALPHGILFLASDNDEDSLAHPACAALHAAWAEHGAVVGGGDDLRTWLRTKLFADHKTRYDNRPIYFPLSSKQKSFVAWVSIHRWQHDTLQVLLADHLRREETRLDGLLADLNRARSEGTKRAEAERRFRDTQRLRDELADFVALVRAIAEEGPAPTDDRCPKREQGARFAMDLDDGVMVNSAALWPLLDPQWKDPKKWWKELATAEGRKDYDWSHLAARYFPARVEKKCHDDPSLAVAHRCFWRLHPAKAYAWELRLQDEIRRDFTIDEPGSNEARAAFLKSKPQQAAALLETEQRRRKKKKDAAEMAGQGELEDVDGSGDEVNDAEAVS